MSNDIGPLLPVMREHGAGLVADLRARSEEAVSRRLLAVRAVLAGDSVPPGARLDAIQALVWALASTARQTGEPPESITRVSRENDVAMLGEFARRVTSSAVSGDWDDVTRRLRSVLVHAESTVVVDAPDEQTGGGA